jgi:hypothetical protein
MKVTWSRQVGVCIVPFDQVAVVAVHRAHERRQRGQQAFRQRAAEAGAPLSEFERKIGQLRAVAGAFAEHKRLHQGDPFTPVLRRFHVRFYVRFCSVHNLFYIIDLRWTKRNRDPV